MLYVLKIGPVETSAGTTNTYTTERDGLILPPFPGKDDESALRMLATQYPHDIRCCSPELAISGAALGYLIGTVPHTIIEPSAVFAFTAALGQRVDGSVEPSALVHFLKAVAEFKAARSWQYWSNDDVLRLHVDGGDTYDLIVMGMAGTSYGIMLSAERGEMSRCAKRHALGYFGQARRTTFLSASLEPEPTYLVDACQRLTGIPIAPELMSIHQGKPKVATQQDVLLLTVALCATARLRQSGCTSTVSISAGGGSLTVTLSAPTSS